MDAKYILEMKSITKIFPGTCALDSVDFNLIQQEVHAIIGENGAGKSTLMNILMGIYQPNSGTIRLFEEDVSIRSPLDALEHGIGLVPQELNLAGELTVSENIFMGREPKNRFGAVDWKKMNGDAAELLDRLHVRGVSPKTQTKTLSAAFQQLVSIARILASGSKIIILDEPTASLTLNETHNLFNIMNELKKDGCTFIYITHHLEEIKMISNRVTILRDGRLVHFCDAKDITIDEMIFYMANQRLGATKGIQRTLPEEVVLKADNFSRAGEFRNISFQVHRSEIFGIAGLVGAGRTELLNAIYGLTKRTGGSLELYGMPVEIANPSDAMKHGIGYVTEERRRLGIFSEMSVINNIMMPSLSKYKRRGLIDYRKINSRGREHIQTLTIKTPSIDTLVKFLSGGNQQKVIIARWLEKQSDILLLDEPTRGIDVRSKGEIYQLIRQMSEYGKTIIVVSSETDELLSVCDRIMVMHEGQLKGFVEKPSDCSREDILKIALQ